MWAGSADDVQTQPPPAAEARTATATDGGPSTTGPTTEPGERLELDEIRRDQCLHDSSFQEPTTYVGWVTLVDCDDPHDLEVVAAFDIDVSGTTYPRETALVDAASGRCEKTFEKYVGTSYYLSELELGVYYPDEASWMKDDLRRAVCYALDADLEPLRGSVAGTAR